MGPVERSARDAADDAVAGGLPAARLSRQRAVQPAVRRVERDQRRRLERWAAEQVRLPIKRQQ